MAAAGADAEADADEEEEAATVDPLTALEKAELDGTSCRRSSVTIAEEEAEAAEGVADGAALLTGDALAPAPAGNGTSAKFRPVMRWRVKREEKAMRGTPAESVAE